MPADDRVRVQERLYLSYILRGILCCCIVCGHLPRKSPQISSNDVNFASCGTRTRKIRKGGKITAKGCTFRAHNEWNLTTLGLN